MGDKNMISGIKKCIEDKDIVGLRYIFLDSLDVDPTFEQYQSDYNICKNIEGMFEPYIELTPLSLSSSDWNMEYWGKIKFDQKKNFSEKRFEHMRTIAKEVHAEKVKRLMAEREEKKVKLTAILNEMPWLTWEDVQSLYQIESFQEKQYDEVRRNCIYRLIEKVYHNADTKEDDLFLSIFITRKKPHELTDRFIINLVNKYRNNA